MSNLPIREAKTQDLQAILDLLMDDDLGKQRENSEQGSVLPTVYLETLIKMIQEKHNGMYVAELDGRIVGTFQLMFLTSLSFQGGTRAQIESVRVDKSLRGQGYGRLMMDWAIEQARAKDCALIQLSSHKTRHRAHHFYEQLGFEKSHVGMKLLFTK